MRRDPTIAMINTLHCANNCRYGLNGLFENLYAISTTLDINAFRAPTRSGDGPVVKSVVFGPEGTGFDPDQGGIDLMSFSLESNYKSHAPCLRVHVKPSVTDVVIARVTIVVSGPQLDPRSDIKRLREGVQGNAIVIRRCVRAAVTVRAPFVRRIRGVCQSTNYDNWSASNYLVTTFCRKRYLHQRPVYALN
ncbi:hypothetical protein EVAR_51814_1 [Eumeta japonica]|uniref:Uncharacterized protein n=1 Tax=Eumeta variegata TaxID=151549 RepID=A0A4C1XZR3_EUMVA|nr:hypothetical protein EVAR_51814_1 [Eumeta japonica]